MKLPARAQRVDEPSGGALSIELYVAGEKAYLVAIPSLSPPLELLSERPRGGAASPFVSQLRRHLVGATLHRVRVDERGFALELEGRTGRLSLIGDRREGVALHRDARPILGSRRASGPADDAPALSELSSLRASHDRSLVDEERASSVRAARASLRRELKRALARLERKRGAIEGDAARAREAPTLRAEAEALLIHLGRIERGRARVRLELPEGGAREIHLDPRKTPEEEVDERFRRARKLERGEAIARARLAEVERELRAARAELEALEEAGDEAILSRAAERAPEGPSPKRSAKESARRLPYRRFVSRDGMEIFVGRSAADNDTLTLRVARPRDLFLHARGITGSHVIVRNDRGEVPVQTLLDAATLAVHFSAAAKEPTAEVQYTERRYVRKGKGLAKGAVRVDRERVILLEMERSRLRRLLGGRDQARPAETAED